MADLFLEEVGRGMSVTLSPGEELAPTVVVGVPWPDIDESPQRECTEDVGSVVAPLREGGDPDCVGGHRSHLALAVGPLEDKLAAAAQGMILRGVEAALR
jgi:hypothetical protein